MDLFFEQKIQYDISCKCRKADIIIILFEFLSECSMLAYRLHACVLQALHFLLRTLR
jgi:hypothetical protein